MGWFSEWLQRRKRRNSNQNKQVRTFRPDLRELETRVVPAAVGGNFINHGGPVLGAPKVELVFLGDAWTSNGTLQSEVQSFAQNLVKSSFMTVLNQYGVSAGSVDRSVVLPASLGGGISTNQLQNILTQDINNGTLPAPDANTVFFVLTPPNVTVYDNPFQAPNFLGYHSSLFDRAGSQVAYAVVPYPGGTNPSDPGLTAFQSLTDTFSHELAEAATDPYVNAQGYPSGWDDYSYAPGDIYDGEVGDIAESAPVVYLNGDAVTQLWSNAAGSVVAPAGATTSPTSGTPALDVSVPGITIQGGTAFGGTVATLTGTDANATATINWGDGTSDNPDTTPGSITTDASGNVVVQGTHTYTTAGSFTITVTVTDGSNTASGSGTATVTTPPTPVALSLTHETITAQAGSEFSGTVAEVGGTDATSASLSATIDWGDGTAMTPDTTTGTVTTDANGNVIVQGTHTYQNPGQYSVKVTVTDGSDSATTTSHATVTGSTTSGSLTVTGASVAAVTGQPFLATVATVSDPGGSRHDLVAEIDWGDGSRPEWVLLDGPDAQGNFDVAGFHRYGTAGNYTVTVTVFDRDTGASATGTATANVEDSGSLSVTASRIETTAGTSFSGTVATVSGVAATDTLTATIDWGDGSALDTTATVTTDSNGNLVVQGTHTYANVGNYRITVTVDDATTKNRDQDSTLADVDRAVTTDNIHVASVNLAATAGASFQDGIAAVYAPGIPASNLSVSINWGDSTTDSTASASKNVQLVPFGTHGVYIVVGSHSYANPGSYTITVTVTDTATSTSVSSTSTATVTATGTTTTPTTPTTTAGPTTTPPTPTTPTPPTSCPTPPSTTGTTPTTSTPTTNPTPPATTSTTPTSTTPDTTPTPTIVSVTPSKKGRHHHAPPHRASRKRP
jgi:hypothetical protein